MPKIPKSICYAVTLCVALAIQPVGAQVSFVEVSDTSGLGDYERPIRGFGSGFSAADFDDDGDIDIFVPTGLDDTHKLYRNLGNGTFEEVAADLGLASTERARAALWLDYDADHRLDLLVTSDCYTFNCEEVPVALRLYRQTEGGTFVDVTAAAGLLVTDHAITQHRSGTAAGDVNGDGYLDIVVGFWDGTLELYLNQGNGTFVDATQTSEFAASVVSYHQPVILDLDGDGLQDVYSAVDFTENRLWQNLGITDGMPSFLEVAQAAGCANAMNDMGVAVGDPDGDGDPDLYVTNIFREGQYNVLLRNDSSRGAPAFTEISDAAGVRDGGWGWGTTFLDVDNDTDLDLAETNGWQYSTWDGAPRLFIHQGTNPPTYVDGAASAGLTDLSWGSTLVAFDYDRDGDLDLVENYSRVASINGEATDLLLHQNQLDRTGGDRNYLVIRPRMTGRNARAIGARVEVEVGGQTLQRWITAGMSYLGQEPAEAFFGLGSATVADRVTVHWPADGDIPFGSTTVLTDVPAETVQTVIPTDVFIDGFESGGTGRWAVTVGSVGRSDQGF